MHKINGLPYLDLTPYVDIEGLKNIEKDIALGLVKSKMGFHDSSANRYNCLDQSRSSMLHETTDEMLMDQTGPFYNEFRELRFNRTDCAMFVRYMKKVQTLGQLIYLRSLNKHLSIGLKSFTNGCSDTVLYKNFPSLKEWINQLKIFDQIGRIIFWLNTPGEMGSIHRDTYQGWPDNFIHINLDPERKTVFLLDDDKNKINITSPVSVFDIRNYHGSQGHEFHGWTLRIDGLYNKEWAQKVGIWEHFNYESAPSYNSLNAAGHEPLAS